MGKEHATPIYTKMNAPLNFEYDLHGDVLTIEGVRYSGAIFRAFGGFEVGRAVRIMGREDGTLTLQKVEWVLAERRVRACGTIAKKTLEQLPEGSFERKVFEEFLQLHDAILPVLEVDGPGGMPAVRDTPPDCDPATITRILTGTEFNEAEKQIVELEFQRRDRNSFFAKLYEVIFKADPMNLERLALAFPEHVAAMKSWREDETTTGLSERLRAAGLDV